MLRTTAILFLAWFVLWGVLVPDFDLVGDDAYHHFELSTVDTDASLVHQLYRVVFEAAGGGHFKPTQDVICILAREARGEAWAPVVLTILTLLHLANAILLASWAGRLGLSELQRLLVGLLFFLHPVVDESLSQMLFGPNVLGVFFTLVGLRLWWWPADEEGRWSVSIPRLLLGGLCVLLAMGSNVNFLATTPVVLGLAQLVRWPRARGRAAVLLPGLVLVLATGLSALHRHMAYGTVTTQMAPYQAALEEERSNDFAREALDHLVLMKPSAVIQRDAVEYAPPWPEGPSFDLPTPWFAAGWLDALLGLGLIVALWFGLQSGPGSSRLPIRVSVAGLIVLAAGIGPYLAFLPTIGLHRYLYVALPGVVLVSVALLELLFPARWPARSGERLQLLAGLALVGLFLAISIESRRAIHAAHVMTPRMTQALAAHVTEDIKAVQVIGYPIAMPRSGHWFLAPEHLRILLARETGRSDVQMAFPGWLAEVFEGRGIEPGRDDHVMLVFDAPDRVRAIEEDFHPRDAGELRALLANDLIRRNRQRDPFKLLREATRPVEIGYWAESLGQAGEAGVRTIRGAWFRLDAEIDTFADMEPASERRARTASSALLGAWRSWALDDPASALALLDRKADPSDELLLRVVESLRELGDSDLTRTWIARLADGEKIDGGQASVLARDRGYLPIDEAGVAEYQQLAVRWRSVIERWSEGREAPDAAAAVAALQSYWEARGVPRPDLGREAARLARLAKGESPEGGWALPAKWWDNPRRPAEAALRFHAAEQGGWYRGGRRADLILSVVAGPEGLPGGPHRLAGRVVMTWSRGGEVVLRQVASIGSQDVPGNHQRTVALEALRPEESGPHTVRISLEVGGEEISALPPVPVDLPPL